MNTNPWGKFHGPNLGFIVDMYDRYLQDAEQVDPELRHLFETWGAPILESEPESVSQPFNLDLLKLITAMRIADDIRAKGHLEADINPLQNKTISFEQFLSRFEGITQSDLAALPGSIFGNRFNGKNGLEALKDLFHIYTGKLAFEYHHLQDENEKNWLTDIIESSDYTRGNSIEKKRALYKRLVEVEFFEQFLHKTYVGAKRFSIEGLDTLVPILDEIIASATEKGVKNINIGMAHRGRLNVLTHVIGKPYEMLLAEFQNVAAEQFLPEDGSFECTFGWNGDVKYHLGGVRHKGDVRITLANNPSHLEFVNPVISGFTRAAQDDRTSPGAPKHDVNRALGIVIHGDAAFIGQGVVAETLNMSQLPGYGTGGIIHIIANNMIGFTTEVDEGRSTRYASDLAKGFDIPIIHVNADDPEAVISAGKLAVLYRQTFKKDILIDLIGYRRYGHNEMDEPMMTNPLMYQNIHQHPPARVLYKEQLIADGVIDEDNAASIENEISQRLREAHDRVVKADQLEHDLTPPQAVLQPLPDVDTKVPFEKLRKINDELLDWPEHFDPLPKLGRIIQRRRQAFHEAKIDWAHAETLAFASIVADGIPVRLTGQDSQRGTFVQRHLVLHDHKTGEKLVPIHFLSEGKASFEVHNSPLSETGVLGFEYGYNVYAPDTLVLWEAQFGEFANGAQAMFDQFISSGRAKWGEKSGIVVLLPHGYEGQGPEHSSARIERFLTLAAENNWIVANMTRSSQYFHILRRQALNLQNEAIRPLIIFTPKSLLRHPLVFSSAEELAEGSFKPVLEQHGLGENPDKVERLILCTGKVAIDLEEQLANIEERDWFHILRIEELYPFPAEILANYLDKYTRVKEIVWVQEEPQNMGAWNYVAPQLQELKRGNQTIRYIGRPARAATSEGDLESHKKEQEKILRETFSRTVYSVL